MRQFKITAWSILSIVYFAFAIVDYRAGSWREFFMSLLIGSMASLLAMNCVEKRTAK